MTATLLATKLHVPPSRPRERIVPRPHLLARLDQGLRLGRGLTLISAPAGFGKTTLVLEWVQTRIRKDAENTSLRVAWLSLDEHDNDPVRFWTYVVAAFRMVDPGLGQGVLEVLQPNTAPQPGTAPSSAALLPSPESFLAPLVNQLERLTEPLLLVLDDYHVIQTEAIHRALEFLLGHLPPPVHLVIATRADPPLPLARLRVRGRLTELRQTDLRFTAAEAADFMNRAMGLNLSADQVAALEARTEGWIAGLQLAALSLHERDAAGSDAFIDTFTGADRFVVDYLLDEVLLQQPQPIQHFLLHTAILDRLTAPLCDALLQEPPTATPTTSPNTDQGIRNAHYAIRLIIPSPSRDTRHESLVTSHEILTHLDQSNLFLVPLDHRREWYRYHRLFADLLRQRLAQTAPDLVPVLHRRASRWHAAHGSPDEAIQHALAAHDLPQAADLIQEHAESALITSQLATLLQRIAALPEPVLRARPLLCAYQAGALLLAGHPLEKVQSRLQDVATGSPDDITSGAAAVFQAMIATLQGDVLSATQGSQQALSLLPEKHPMLRTLAANNLGLTHLMRGDFDAALQAFEEVVQMSERTGNTAAAVGPLSNVAGLYMMHGQLHKAQRVYERALALATDAQGRRLPVAGKVLMGLGELYREWNDLEVAARCLAEGVERVGQYLEIGPIIGYTSLAYVKQAQGDPAAARDFLQQAQALAARFDATKVDDVFVAACQARLDLAQGRLDAARHWAERRGPDWKTHLGTGGPTYYDMRAIEGLTLARVYLAQGQAGEGLAVLQPLLEAERQRRRTRRVIEILALQALAYQTREDAEAALAALHEALSLAQPEGYVRTFVDLGEPMARLLYAAAEQGIAPQYAGELLAVFARSGEQDVAPDQVRPAPSSAALIEPLSERELEVLQLVAQGLSNREIAQRLFISLSTVKGHTSNIYGKLEVSNRTQAVTRARTLGLLPNR